MPLLVVWFTNYSSPFVFPPKSGKTLAYLVPTLSTLSQTLFTRQRIRIKDEEDVDDLMGDLVDRVIVQTSPTVRGQGYDQVGGGGGGMKTKGSGMGAALSSLGKSGTDVKSPVALIVVPTRELGVQIALLLFQLVGGNTKSTPTERSGRKNMFRYKGPKGVKIGCVLDEQMSNEGLKLQTDIAITTPQYLSKLIEEKDVDPSKLRVVIYDEADLGLEQTSEDNLKLLFDNNEETNNRREFSRISYLVGATVTESLGNLAVKDEILPEGKSFIATATRFAPLTKEDAGSSQSLKVDKSSSSSSAQGGGTATSNANSIISSSSDASMATLKDLRLCLDPGLRHERVVVSGGAGLICLARMLRKELREYEIANATLAEAKIGSGNSGGDDDNNDAETNDLMRKLAALREETKDLEEDFGIDSIFDLSKSDFINTLQRPRVVVFFPDEDEARDAIFSLRDAMWGEHKLGVLLPKTGEKPLTIMEAFKKGDISVLLATPNSIRGLDFPALTHVYTLFLPANDPREYLHLAGRVGRIGQQGSVRGQGGRVTTILDISESPRFHELAEFLGFQYDDVPPLQAEVTEESDVEDMRRYLEDTITLLGTVDDPVANYASADTSDVDDVDDSNDDDDDDDEEEEHFTQ
jgi:superfamily II DNA/RNA helicase